jgi:hypothetical protein
MQPLHAAFGHFAAIWHAAFPLPHAHPIPAKMDSTNKKAITNTVTLVLRFIVALLFLLNWFTTDFFTAPAVSSFRTRS